MNTINVNELFKFKDDKVLNEEYIKFKLGLGINDCFEYRETEIKDIYDLFEKLNLDYDAADDFYYGFRIKHLDVEFDLIKTCDDCILDIEFKHEHTSNTRIMKQLRRNAKYLSFMNPKVYSFCFIASEDKLLYLSDNELFECNIDFLKKHINESKYFNYDINNIFLPKEMLVSPFNNVEKFIGGKYLLTDAQEEILTNLIKKINNSNDLFFGVTGKPGTGKTLLIYDLVKKITSKKILIVHCGQLNEGHSQLDSLLENSVIISARNIHEYLKNDYDVVVLDEAQRIYRHQLDELEDYCNINCVKCVFSFDAEQRIMKSEYKNQSAEHITELVGKNLFVLPKNIRISNELNVFIQGLLDRKRRPQNYPFTNINIIYEPTKQKTRERIFSLRKKGYTFISYTKSRYSKRLDYQDVGKNNTHNVIGQEFDSICMAIDENFYYGDDNKLTSNQHPNDDYLFVQLLYQGLTRARDRIALIITDIEMLKEILQIVKIKY